MRRNNVSDHFISNLLAVGDRPACAHDSHYESRAMTNKHTEPERQKKVVSNTITM